MNPYYKVAIRGQEKMQFKAIYKGKLDGGKEA